MTEEAKEEEEERWQKWAHKGFPGGTRGGSAPASAGDIRDTGLVPGSGRPLEEGVATHSSILAWRIPADRGVWQVIAHRVARILTQLKRYGYRLKSLDLIKDLRGSLFRDYIYTMKIYITIINCVIWTTPKY